MSYSLAVEVEHVKQVSTTTCVHACLSMVTGVPIKDLIDRWGSEGLGSGRENVTLTELGLLPEIVTLNNYGMEYLWEYDEYSVYMATVPSLNIVGGSHRVVITLGEHNEVQLFDPNFGRPGANAWETGSILGIKGFNRLPIHQVTRLFPMACHNGNTARKALYDNRKAQDNED